MPSRVADHPKGDPPNLHRHPKKPETAVSMELQHLPVEILTMILRDLPAETLIRIARTSHTFAESAAYVLRNRIFHALEILELTLLFAFGTPDTHPESVKCLYRGIDGLSNSPQGQQVMTDVFAIFHPTPYSLAHMPVGGPSVDETLTQEITFEEPEKFVQFTGNLSLVFTMATTFIADGTKIGGTMVVRLQRDWLEKETTQIISLDHQNMIKIMIAVRKTAIDTFEIRVTELHICAVRLLVALEKVKDTNNRGTQHIRLPIALPAGIN